MAAPIEHAPGYDHVLSDRAVEDVERLLTSAGPDWIPNSLTLSRELTRRRGLLALRGVGRELWSDEDAQDYVDRLRDEWTP